MSIDSSIFCFLYSGEEMVAAFGNEDAIAKSLVGILFLLGPLCGIVGARTLSRGLVDAYLALCFLKIVDLAICTSPAPLSSLIVSWLGQVWITRVALGFRSALAD